MALDAKKVYALSKTYTDETVVGGGAIKGKNCTISNITSTSDRSIVTFQWTLDDGTVQTDTMTIKNGKDGVGVDGIGIASITFKEKDSSGNNVYTVTYTDESTDEIVCPIGPQGEQGAMGPGVRTGGTAGQILAKNSGTDFDTKWVDAPSGSIIDSELSTSSHNPVENMAIALPIEALQGSMLNKANKVASATNGNFAGLDAEGNLVDSHRNAINFLERTYFLKLQSALGVKNLSAVEYSTITETGTTVIKEESGYTVQGYIESDTQHDGIFSVIYNNLQSLTDICVYCEQGEVIDAQAKLIIYAGFSLSNMTEVASDYIAPLGNRLHFDNYIVVSGKMVPYTYVKIQFIAESVEYPTTNAPVAQFIQFMICPLEYSWVEENFASMQYSKPSLSNFQLLQSLDDWTESVTQANGVAVFDNLNPDYGYKLCYDDEGATGDLTVPGISNINKTSGTETGTIKLTYSVDGTDSVTKYKLRILK